MFGIHEGLLGKNVKRKIVQLNKIANMGKQPTNKAYRSK